MTVVDLFSGCGGFTAGFVAAGGYEPLAAVEMDREAAATYTVNFGDHVHVGDITRWVDSSMPQADVVIGGPPCQGFSALGKQDPDDPRSALWNEYVRALLVVDPDWFVLENVPQFLKSQQFADLESEASPAGRLAAWRIESYVLNAADYGAAQARKRAIIIGRRADLPRLGAPAPAPARAVLKDVLGEVAPDVRRIDLPDSTIVFRGEPMSGVFKMADLHVTREPHQQSLLRYAAIPYGGNRFDLTWELQTPGWLRHLRGSGDVMGRLRWETPSVTIRTEFFKPEKGRYLHPEADRPITHLEAALIQGFPGDFLWCGSKASIARQIGNAVPVPLGSAIARHLRAHVLA